MHSDMIGTTSQTLICDSLAPTVHIFRQTCDWSRRGPDPRVGGLAGAGGRARLGGAGLPRGRSLADPPDGRAADAAGRQRSAHAVGLGPTVPASAAPPPPTGLRTRWDWVQQYPQVLESVLTNPDTGARRSTRERYILAQSPVGAALLLSARGTKVPKGQRRRQ